MDGYLASRNGSSSSSNNFTYAQVLPPECANEIGKAHVDGHPALYLSPSTVRALKVYSEMEPITTTLDAFFKKSFAATQNDNINSRNLPTSPPPQTRQPATPRTLTLPPPMMTDFTSNLQKNSDCRKTVIVLPVESESFATNQQIQGASCVTNPCTNENPRSRESIIAREIFTTCLCPIWDGWSRETLPPIPDSYSKQSKFTIPKVLSSHQKNLIRCYPELSFLHSVPRLPEISVTVDPALYLQFIIEQLNTHTYPPYPRLCSALNYARDSRLGNDASSSDEEESVQVNNSGMGRRESPKWSTSPNLREFSTITFSPLSPPTTPPHTLPYFNLIFSESEKNEAMKVIDDVKAQITKRKFLVSIDSSTFIPNKTVYRSYSSDLSSEDDLPLRKVMKFHLEN